MRFVVTTLASSMLLLGMLSPCAWAATDPVVSGTVRDLRGAPQGGVLVELLAPNAALIARALTDAHGRFVLHAPGSGDYKLRASLAALLPPLYSNLRLRGGSHTIADLSMAALFQTGSWLPAEDRPSTEPADDWRWTLRSTGNRPLLRLADWNEQGEDQGYSSSFEITPTATSKGQISLTTGDGRFGEGGPHQVLLLDRNGPGGEDTVFRANLGATSPSPLGTSVSLDAGVQRTNAFGGGMRMFVTFASHPEFQSSAFSGMDTLRSAATEKLIFGDFITADVGTLFTAEHLATTRFRSSPYLRVDLKASAGTTIEYRLASDRALQSSEDLDEARLPEEASSDAQGRPVLRKALHQALTATHRTERSFVSVSVFEDHLSSTCTQGSGPLNSQDVAGLPLISDAVTGTMRLTLPGYRGAGLRAAWGEDLTSAIAARVEAELGPAMRTDNRDAPQGLEGTLQKVHAHASPAIAGTLLMTARRTGTRVTVSYRWQPLETLTQVDEFDSDLQQVYLTMQARQRLWTGSHHRQVNGVLQATNLLAEGYQHVPGPKEQALYVAQMPRALQAGLAFSF